MLKGELREIIRERKRLFTRRELDELSLAPVSALKGHPLFRRAATVMMYYLLPDEVDIRPLIEAADGKTVLLPRVAGGENMEIRRYDGPGSIAKGAFGIMEPTGRVFTDYGGIDLVIVPGMAFDDCGRRLGRGRGYYDRFLPLVRQAYKMGVCFAFQKVDYVPTEATDVSMDEVIS